MKTKINLMAGLALLLLAACESPRTDVQTPVPTPPEMTIQAPAEKVRAAAKKHMAFRGYQVTPAGADTLLFDRGAELGADALYGGVYGKDAWRRVRMTLSPAGAATRVTLRPSLVVNRGTADEREEADNSGGARTVMQTILDRIRDEAQAPQ